MRAGVLYAPGDLRVEDTPTPECGPDDVLIQVRYNGLCGTDATEYTKGPMMVPLITPHPGSGHVGATILGHEFIGTVVAEGENVTGMLGKRVACGAGVSCGRCVMCNGGRTNLCSSYYTLGLSTHGGLAEYAAAPANTCVEIPDACTDEDAALAQPLAVAIHAVRRAALRPGQPVAVLGIGAIGSFILAALSEHDGNIIAMDIEPSRLELATKLGASNTVLLEHAKGIEKLRESYPDGIDVVFETSGVDGAAANACELAALGGTVVLVGLNNRPQPLTLAPIVLREVNIVTTVAHVCAEDIPDALALLTKRPLASLLLDSISPLENVVDDAFARLANGTVSGKILVDPRTPST